jgi:hypothetical protein
MSDREQKLFDALRDLVEQIESGPDSLGDGGGLNRGPLPPTWSVLAGANVILQT